MKNNYEKYMEEVWQMKERTYRDFKNSHKKSYIQFIMEELKNLKVTYRKKTI